MKNKKSKIMIVFFCFMLLMIEIVLKISAEKIQKKTNEEELEIPKIFLLGKLTQMKDEIDKRKIIVQYRSNDLNFDSFATIRIQGAISNSFDKKNYNISFFTEKDCNKEKTVDFRWGNLSKYTLKGNWMDQFQSRNIVTAQIASEMNQKYNVLPNAIHAGMIDGFPVEVYENNEFLGLYTLNLAKDNLFYIEEGNPNMLVLLGRDLNYTRFTELETMEWKNFKVEYGEGNEITLQKLNRLIDFVKNSSDEVFVKEFQNYFNLDAILNCYCLMQYAQLTDNVLHNFFLVTYDGEVWYVILYDLELSWGNSYESKPFLQEYDNRDMKQYIKLSYLWKRFSKLFSNEIRERYQELRQDIFTKENVLNKMNAFYQMIPQETWKKEYTKWGNEPAYSLMYLEKYLVNRTALVDKELGIEEK